MLQPTHAIFWLLIKKSCSPSDSGVLLGASLFILIVVTLVRVNVYHKPMPRRLQTISDRFRRTIQRDNAPTPAGSCNSSVTPAHRQDKNDHVSSKCVVSSIDTVHCIVLSSLSSHYKNKVWGRKGNSADPGAVVSNAATALARANYDKSPIS